jgi:uncharacterized protein (TIGR00730 family)
MTAAKAVGAALGREGYDVIYGGGTQGVMGAAAQAARDAGAHVTAVVLKKYAHEAQIAAATQIHVDTEAERFEKLTSYGSPAALVMLPGGPGALREALQGLEKAVYEDGPPLILVRGGDYLDGVRHTFHRAIDAGLIKEERRDKLREWTEGDDIRTLIEGPALPAHKRPSAKRQRQPTG